MYVMTHFGWRTLLAVFGVALLYFAIFRAELQALATRPAVADTEVPDADAVAGGHGHAAPRAGVDHRRARASSWHGRW